MQTVKQYQYRELFKDEINGLTVLTYSDKPLEYMTVIIDKKGRIPVGISTTKQHAFTMHQNFLSKAKWIKRIQRLDNNKWMKVERDL